MEIILKNAMVHYLNIKLTALDSAIDDIENTTEYPEDKRITVANNLMYKRDTILAILKDIEANKIDKMYDEYCIKNGKNRNGEIFD